MRSLTMINILLYICIRRRLAGPRIWLVVAVGRKARYRRLCLYLCPFWKWRWSRICFPLNDVCCDPVKNVLALFLSEVLFRVVKDTEPDPRLFDYLCESIHLLEYADKGIANFHMVFLLGLLHHLGIFPNMESHRVGYYFDMLNGVFTDHIPMHRHYLNKVESAFFSRLLRISFENMSLYGFSRQERVRIIHRILEYYRLHLPDFPEIKSLSVMQSLFD